MVLLVVTDLSPTSSPTVSPLREVASAVSSIENQTTVIAAALSGGGGLVLIGILICLCMRKKGCCAKRTVLSRSSSRSQVIYDSDVELAFPSQPSPLNSTSALRQVAVNATEVLAMQDGGEGGVNGVPIRDAPPAFERLVKSEAP